MHTPALVMKDSVRLHGDTWDKSDLERRLCHALDIAQQTVERLAANGYTDSIEPSNTIRPEKVISETAFLLVAASTVADHGEVKARIQCVARQLIPHARSKRMLLGACLEPALTFDYAQAHICLSRLGWQDRAVDALLRRSANSQARSGRERTPYRMLEQEWLKNIWNNSRRGSDKRIRSMARNSLLKQPMDLLNGSRDDMYAFTHALMYVSDFNIRPSRLPRPRGMILAEAEGVLARCLDEQDYDLAGEVLLAWPLTGNSWSPAAVFGFRVLASVEDKAGFLPGTSTRLHRLNELKGDEHANYLLATAYHTAYVMGLLCSAALQSGRTPPWNLPNNDAPPHNADLILQFLSGNETGAHWCDEFNRLNASERNTIAGLLLNMVLYRKLRQHEYDSVQKLLEVGTGLGLTNNPVSSQAAELLERLAAFSKYDDVSLTVPEINDRM